MNETDIIAATENGGMIECCGKWFARHRLTILWSDDEDDLEERMDELESGKTACLGEGYTVFVHSPTGREVALPDNDLMTDEQRGLVYVLLRQALQEQVGA